jgi:hypothetical protein
MDELNLYVMTGIIVYEKRFWMEMICQSMIISWIHYIITYIQIVIYRYILRDFVKN